MNDFIYIALALFLLLNLAVGLYHSRRVKTLKAYFLGDRDFSTFVLASTIAATWMTGSGFILCVASAYGQVHEKKFMVALCFILPAVLWLASTLCLRMGEFKGTLSLAEAFGKIYGSKMRYIAALAGIVMYLGWTAIQFKVMAGVLSIICGVNPKVATFFVGSIVVVYVASGGIRSIIFTDFLQVAVFFVLLPLFAGLIFFYNSDKVDDIGTIAWERLTNLIPNPFSNQGGVAFNVFWSTLAYSLSMAVQPVLFQRFLVAGSVHKAKRAFSYSAIFVAVVCFMYFTIGILLSSVFPDIKEHTKGFNLLKYIVQHVPNKKFLTLLLLAITAVVMSSADSFINSSASLFSNDLAKPLNIPSSKKLLSARLFSCVFGGLALLLNLVNISFWSFIAKSNFFYLTTITAPIFLAIFGFRTTKRPVFIGMILGLVTGFLWSNFFVDTGVDSNVVGIFANALGLIAFHYLLGEPGGWVGVKDKTPLLAERQRSARRFRRLRKAFAGFSFGSYLHRYLPKGNSAYLLFGLYSIVFSFGSLFLFPDLSLLSSFSWVGFIGLALNAIIATYPFWSPGVAHAQQITIPFWFTGVTAFGFYMPCLLALFSGMQMCYFALLGATLILLCLFYPSILTASLFATGGVLAYLSFAYVGDSFSLATSVSSSEYLYAAVLLATVMLVACWAKKRERSLEKNHISLTELLRTTQRALWQIQSNPDSFKKQFAQTKSAGLTSAYTLSEALQQEIKQTEMSLTAQEKLLGSAKAIAEQVDKSAKYLEKSLHLIEAGVKLERKQSSLDDFLHDFYDTLSEEEGNMLLLSNQIKKKATVQWELQKISRLLQKSYQEIRRQYDDKDYFYLHVTDTTLRYPGHPATIPAIAFSFTTIAQQRPPIAASYAHLDNMPLDPHGSDTPYLHEAHKVVDKHYGYMRPSDYPGTYLIVLPAIIDDIRPKMIEDKPVLIEGLDAKLQREAKLVEVEFFHMVAQRPHYDIMEIERVVQFMKVSHRHQTRKSGHPYYMHPFCVAKYVIENSYKSHMLIAALLHDVVEDTGVPLEEVGIRFGYQVEQLVKRLSNIKDYFKKYKVKGKDEKVALLAGDREATLIKACDRLHNLETLSSMPLPKQKAKAEETRDYYLPVIRQAGFEKLADKLSHLIQPFL